MKYDALIIGGGLGGLTAAAKLAREGKKVLLIEQHTMPGGCATAFRRGNYTMEVGLQQTVLLYDSILRKRIFHELDILNNIEFIPIPEFYRFISEKVDIVIPNDYLKAEAELIEHFPSEEKGIKSFISITRNMLKEYERLPRETWKRLLWVPLIPFLCPTLARYYYVSVGKFVDTVIKNEDLKLALLANLGYYHNDPYTLPLLFFAIAQGRFYLGKGRYIRGGSYKLPEYLSGFIKKFSGEVLLGHLVTKILVENKKAVGIEYIKKEGGGEAKRAYAKVIIANASIPSVAQELLPDKEAGILKRKIKKMEHACSLLTIFLFFKKPAKDFGCRNYCNIFLSPQVKSLGGINLDRSVAEKSFAFVDYGQIDSQLAPAGRGVGVIHTVDYLKNWLNLSVDEYKARKERVAHDFIERLNGIFPGIKEGIDFYEVGTPKTIKRYTLNPSGTAYGFAQIPSQSGVKRIKHKSPIKNLYFASAWTRPGGGFTGAVLSGYCCAEEVLRKYR
ncbi:MAG: NAD(P)/FAD-dependent oxidoreductase [Candidatus Omnitrophota bacterium]|jgi:phytoene dehydrogenase-like protein